MAEDGNNVVVEKPVEIEPQLTTENTVDTSIETALKPKESGIKRRIKINIPGIITTNSSSRKPPTYRWSQQRLHACRPVCTGLHIFVVFLIIGVVFLALGSLFLVLNMRLHEYAVSYTDCPSRFPTPEEANRMGCELIGNETDFSTCAEYVVNISRFDRYDKMRYCSCYCQVNLEIEENMTSPVYVYYMLTNYYQNHRRYSSSWSQRSLRAIDITRYDSFCYPLDKNGSTPYFPCGLIANSFFNDTLMLRGVSINSTDISWETDRNYRFDNPPIIDDNNIISDSNDTGVEYNRNGTILPPNWLTYIDNGQKNESYIVWFRISAFPNFRKLLGRVDLVEGEVLPPGNYTLDIVYSNII
jgi:hypothetical protein